MNRKNHKWTKPQEDLLYGCRHMSPIDIKKQFFASVDSITVQSIADKLSRVVDEREQENYGQPWTQEDETWLRSNMDILSNLELKAKLKRGSKELDQAKWDIRHYGRINPRRTRKLSTPSNKSVNQPDVVPAPKSTMEQISSKSSKTAAWFMHKNNLVHFNMRTRVHNSKQGQQDLVNELRACANDIENNGNFSVSPKFQ